MPQTDRAVPSLPRRMIPHRVENPTNQLMFNVHLLKAHPEPLRNSSFRPCWTLPSATGDLLDTSVSTPVRDPTFEPTSLGVVRSFGRRCRILGRGGGGSASSRETNSPVQWMRCSLPCSFLSSGHMEPGSLGSRGTRSRGGSSETTSAVRRVRRTARLSTQTSCHSRGSGTRDGASTTYDYSSCVEAPSNVVCMESGHASGCHVRTSRGLGRSRRTSAT